MNINHGRVRREREREVGRHSLACVTAGDEMNDEIPLASPDQHTHTHTHTQKKNTYMFINTQQGFMSVPDGPVRTRE